MRKFKRLMAAVLTAAMLATFLPAGVLAAEGDEPISPDSETVTSTDQTVDLEESQNEGELEIPPVMDDLYVTVSGEKVALIPDEDAPSTMSLIGLPVQSYQLYLNNVFPEELKAVDFSDVLSNLQGSDPATQNVDEIAAYAMWGYISEDTYQIDSNFDDAYIVLGEDKTINLSYDRFDGDIPSNGRYTIYMDLVIGTVDQLNTTNKRYRITANIDLFDDFYGLIDDAEVYSTDDPREKVTVFYSNLSHSYSNGQTGLYISVDGDTWKPGQETYLGLKPGYSYNNYGLTAKFYEGHYESAEAIAPGVAVEITDQIWNQGSLSTAGGYKADYTDDYTNNTGVELTLVLERGGKIVLVEPVSVRMTTNEFGVWLNGLYTSSSSYNDIGNVSYKPVIGMDDYQVYNLYSNYSISQGYYARINAHDPKNPYASISDNIKAAYLGNLTQEQIDNPEGSLQDIKDTLFSGGHLVTFTEEENKVFFTVIDKNDKLWHFGVEITITFSIYEEYSLYKMTEDGSFVMAGQHYSNNNDTPYTYRLNNGNPEDGTYYLRMNYVDSTNKGDISVLKGAYVGQLSLSETAEAADVKNSLFGTGLEVNFSQYPNGIVYITVVDKNNTVHHYSFNVLLPEAGPPTPFSTDTYFHVTGVNREQGNPNVYVMRPLDDSDYYWGYQTVLLLNKDGSKVTSSEIVPTFRLGNKVRAFAGHTTVGNAVESSQLQESGKSAITFTPGKPVQYSAAAEDRNCLKNYFVTFLTQDDENPLFVNGTNDESNYQESPSGEKLPVRNVQLVYKYQYHNDIFFANLGSTPLTGLKVELTGADGTGEAQNVALDDYWTIGDTKTLASFNSAQASGYNYDELPNVGKIRLVSKKNEDGTLSGGKISGLLTISADGVEPVKILLTGTAGSLQLNTDTILDGVKFVSYSSVIQTNYVTDGATNAVSFDITGGRLPNGINIQPNGELYGVPTEIGPFTFTVTARCQEEVDGQTVTRTVSKTYTMNIINNDDFSVWQYEEKIFGGSKTYTATIAIPNEAPNGTVDLGNIPAGATIGNNSWQGISQELKSEGPYNTFINRVFIDGIQLTAGVDYTSEEGSTRITILNQTLKSFGNGKHTISAEYRIGNKDKGELHRTAENYTLISLGGGSRPGASSGSSSSSSSSSSDRNSGTASSSFAINVADVVNGSASPSVSSAKSGTKVTVTISPDAGYAPTGLTVTRSNGRTVSTVKVSDTEYTFIMPAGAVTVTPSFQQIFVPVVGSFTDVRENDWFREAVEYVFDRGLMVGTSGNTFNPDGTVSRSMLVTVLYSLEGKPAVSDVSPFTDIQAGQWFAAPVIWAAENNLVAGLGDGTFGADASLTREQAAVILYSYAKLKGYDVEPSSDLAQFADTGSISSFALPALQWANAAGLINGYSQDTLAPGGTTTRAQLAAILRSFCENIIK